MYEPITTKQVLEAYFFWPWSRPETIARAYRADSDRVFAIFKKERLPYAGVLFSEDRLNAPARASS